MKVVLAIDSFKGSCTSFAAGEAVRRGILRADPAAEAFNIPVADGGEGTVDAIIGNGRGRWQPCPALGPLGGRVSAGFGVLPDGTAVIEMSAASGLTLVPPGGLNPLLTTTYGTGQLIRAALDAGHRKMLIGLGGSATNDGGAGMAQALGVSLRDRNGVELGYGGAALQQLHTVDLTGLDPRLKECAITCAVDVSNPLCGVNGASAVYGPQKGATPEMVNILDDALRRFANVLRDQHGVSVSDLPGAGAAGGLGAGLYAFCSASFRPGIEAVLDIVGFDEFVLGADYVVTGEGRLDGQTVYGKVPIGVSGRAKTLTGAPVFALVGSIGEGHEAVYRHGIDGVFAIADGPLTLAESCARAEPLLERAGEALARTVAAVRRSVCKPDQSSPR